MKLWPGWRGRTRTDDGRWVVVDVETSGLDTARDRLIAIAGVALVIEDGRPRVALGDSFELVLRQPDAAVDKRNILLHGIGAGAQRCGMDAEVALSAFENWVGASPLIAFHAIFDRTMIERAMRTTIGRVLPNAWIDLAHVAEVVQPDVPARSLDEWLARFDIVCAVRHQAAADTLATAELLQALWPAIRAQGMPEGIDGLRRIASKRRWLPKARH